MSNVLDLSSGTGILTYASSYRIHQKFFFYFFFYIFIDMPIIQFCCMPFGNSFIVSDRHISFSLMDVFFNRQWIFVWAPAVLISPTSSSIRMKQTSYMGFYSLKNRKGGSLVR